MPLGKDGFYLKRSNMNSFIQGSFNRCGFSAPNASEIENIVGMSAKNLVDYLEATFFKRYEITTHFYAKFPIFGTLHIDHIIPINEAKTREDIVRLCHYKNLQLVIGKDNLSKEHGENIDVSHKDPKAEIKWFCDNIETVMRMKEYAETMQDVWSKYRGSGQSPEILRWVQESAKAFL